MQEENPEKEVLKPCTCGSKYILHKCVTAAWQKKSEKKAAEALDNSLKDFKEILQEKMDSTIQNKSDILKVIENKEFKLKRTMLKKARKAQKKSEKAQEDKHKNQKKPCGVPENQSTIAKLNNEMGELEDTIIRSKISEDELLLISNSDDDMSRFPTYRKHLEEMNEYVGRLITTLDKLSTASEEQKHQQQPPIVYEDVLEEYVEEDYV